MIISWKTMRSDCSNNELAKNTTPVSLTKRLHSFDIMQNQHIDINFCL